VTSPYDGATNPYDGATGHGDGRQGPIHDDRGTSVYHDGEMNPTGAEESNDEVMGDGSEVSPNAERSDEATSDGEESLEILIPFVVANGKNEHQPIQH
jgi:hypothetical protein